ncbi:MAG: nucleotidyl transferase AbiEii/AbiGii toxin family protein [Acidiferrobacterales bacterium]
MDLATIRRLIVSAVVSDDFLFETLVFKGGNALNLIHGIGSRASLDIDFSMSRDFKNLEGARTRLFKALQGRLSANGYMVFDERMEPKPSELTDDPTWGGYTVEFKLIERDKYEKVKGKLEDMRRQSVSVDGAHTGSRKFKIQISKYEYCEGKTEAEVEYFSCYVYTPLMIGVEKLRAICQQMPEYTPTIHKVARARDFYDIHCIIEAEHLDLSEPENLELIRSMFQAKKVPLYLLGKISETRDFHAAEWPAVRDSISEEDKGFDFYFDSIVQKIETLKPLWVE